MRLAIASLVLCSVGLGLFIAGAINSGDWSLPIVSLVVVIMQSALTLHEAKRSRP